MASIPEHGEAIDKYMQGYEVLENKEDIEFYSVYAFVTSIELKQDKP